MKKIVSLVRKMVEEHALIENGDKIAVGVSGGKDSLTLLTALREIQKYGSIKFELMAIAIDLSNGEMDFAPTREYCEKIGTDFLLVNSNVFEIVFDIRKEKNPCSLCANLRRGLLNTAAKENGCNKVALAHNMDDLLETFFMALTFEGRLQAMQPKTYLSRMDITVIRPLLLCEEKDIISFSKGLPVIKNTCPKDHFTERENSKKIIEKLEEKYPGCKRNYFNAITDPRRYNLWNKK